MGQLEPERKSLWRRRFGGGVAAIAGVTPAAVLVRQAVVTVATAATLSGGTLLGAQAADEWHRAVREEIKWSALLQNDVHYVYLGEGPEAWQVVIAEVLAARAQEMTGEPGLVGQIARIDATAHTSVATQFRSAHTRNDMLLATDRYRLPEGGQDLPRRLADIRHATGAAAPDLVRRGDERFRWATLLAAASVPLVALHLLLLVRARRTRRSVQPDGADRRLVVRTRGPGALVRRAAAAAPVLAWAAVTVLPAVQLYQAKLEVRTQQIATGQAVQISTALACSSMLSTFSVQSRQMLNAQHMTSLGGQLAALDVADAELGEAVLRLGAAREPDWDRLARIEQTMSRPPTTGDGVDAATVRMVTASSAELERLTAAQRRSADLANVAGDRAGLLSLAIFLAALVGAVRRAGPRNPQHIAGLLLISASAAAATWALVA